MPSFLEIISQIASYISFDGISLKSLIPSNKNKIAIEKYLDFIKTREVLFSSHDDEQQGGVIASLQEIKAKTEDLSANCEGADTIELLERLRLEFSKILRALHQDDIHKNAKVYVMTFSKLLYFRIEFAKYLALLCTANGVEPKDTRLQKYILDFSIRPKS